MRYRSTRTEDQQVTDAAAIVAGLAPDGGLFVPTEIPRFAPGELEGLLDKDYSARAAHIMGRFLPSFSTEELLGFCRRAYAFDRFPAEGTAPLTPLGDGLHVLELFHGPTCAFKDFALQMLPFLLSASLQKTGAREEVMILVATSGDTGKAAMTGFADVERTHICVFYPDGGVSPLQRLQMVTQEGENVMAAAVKGNFDDTQNGVKAIFSDADFAARLLRKGLRLSSANSINWGRLVPQIAYYVSAYCDLCKRGALVMGEKVNLCVPTGNFGNILAAWFAKEMGLPAARFICASNRNNVLTDFIETGLYESRRPFYMTASPSMDILISSNLERLLFLLSGDGGAVGESMRALRETGAYRVDAALHAKIRDAFSGGFCTEEAAAETIRNCRRDFGYIPDTHTAVALRVYADYRARTGDERPCILASTASPFKFPASVLAALGESPEGDEFAQLARLGEVSGKSVPPQLATLREKEVRFPLVAEKADMRAVVEAYTEKER